MTHLATDTKTPIKHWIVALDERLAALPAA
jgi:hypothetical protein